MILSTVLSFLEISATSFPNKTALVFGKNKTTYKELLIASKKIAVFLSSCGKKDGSVALFMENSPNWLSAYFGIMASGMTCVPLSLRSSDENLVSQISLSGARFVIVSKKFFPRWNKLVGQFKNPLKIVEFNTIRISSDKALKFKSQNPKFPVILFTSGTTSSQKAVHLSHEAVLASTRNIIDYLKLDYDDIYYAMLPFYHSFGLGNVHTTLATGGTVIISNTGTDLRNTLRDIIKYRATFWAATPYTLRIATDHFLKDLVLTGKYLRKICTNTGPMSSEVTKVILKNLPTTHFFTYYGLTEASRTSFLHYNLYPDKLESVGRPSPNVSVCIVNEKNKFLPPQQTGEVCIKGPHVVGTLRNGWFYTGDAGYFDKDGFLYVTGRKDDRVDIGGEKFSLEEVDKTLLSCKGVQDAASFLVKHPRMDFIVGCAVPTSCSNINEKSLRAELLAICKKKLGHHQLPSKIIFLDSIPRTDNGKTRRNFLKEKYAG
jgi:long-chain acyl-CoA synthetase